MTSDWVMVIITGVYVIATIFICCANFKSAKASKEQLDEMQRQYADANRPVLETEFHYTRRTWYYVRFVNRGTKTAQHVKIKFEQSSIDSLPEESFQRELSKIQDRECIIGVGQYYDVFVGSNKLRKAPNLKPLIGTIEYESQGRIYKDSICVDLEHYSTFYSATTDDEDMLKHAKEISEELSKIRGALVQLEKAVEKLEPPIQNE